MNLVRWVSSLFQFPDSFGKNSFIRIFIVVSVFVLPHQTVVADDATGNPQAAVAMPDQYSAAVAQEILQKGGNAVDAAVAAAFVLAVTYPEAGNLGGGGFMTLFLPGLEPKHTQGKESQQVQVEALTKHPQHAYFLDYREKAPQAAFRDLYLDEKGEVIPYKSLVGYQASGVPGTVMGLWQVHQQFGSLTWKSLLAPAIKLAEKGFSVPQQMVQTAKWFENWIEGKSSDPLNFSKFFAELKTGKVFKQPLLAKTLSRIADKGPSDFYHQQTAKMLVKQMQENGGLISLEDLQAYQAQWREPVMGKWMTKGQTKLLISAPPPSSGGIALMQFLKLYQILLPEFEQAVDQATKAGVPELAIRAHFYAELSKRVYADRAHYLGDPDFVNVPVQQLISEDYLQQRAKDVSLERISKTEKIHPGKIESPETTHFSIVDAQGNAVANTYTLNMPFGSGVVIEKAGFLMNDEMDDFSTKPGVANVFGVVGAKANEIAPEKRMLSSMTPAIITAGNEVEMVLGTPGGSTIITSNFQTIVNYYERGMTAQQSVDAIRVHHQLLPKNRIAHNPELDDAVKEELQLMGYELQQNNYMGDVQLIVKRQSLQAASDYRGRGISKVFEVSAEMINQNKMDKE